MKGRRATSSQRDDAVERCDCVDERVTIAYDDSLVPGQIVRHACRICRLMDELA
jgi:hypothetical protein